MYEKIDNLKNKISVLFFKKGCNDPEFSSLSMELKEEINKLSVDQAAELVEQTDTETAFFLIGFFAAETAK